MAKDFIKAKLSRKAIDDLARRYSNDLETKPFKYKTADNTVLNVSGYQILMRKWKKRIKILIRSNISVSLYERF